MLTKIDNTSKFGKQAGGFGIQILYPGNAFAHAILNKNNPDVAAKRINRGASHVRWTQRTISC
ncbi:MAG: hypothetical protein IPM42_05805 [Saprospiraceae bacterium]|nr:hypothetical protein [Saprospiraceae bacterium]